MEVTLSDACCTVKKQKGDKPFKSSSWGTAESGLLYAVKQFLNGEGHDLIKKRMWKDGHLVDDEAIYLRTRNAKSPKPHVMIYNKYRDIYDAGREFNAKGEVKLDVTYDIFNCEQVEGV
mgnify:FL=1